MAQKTSTYSPRGKFLYDDLPQYQTRTSLKNKYDIPSTTKIPYPEEIEFLNDLIEKIFDKKYTPEKLFWLLRWIGIDCPFDNNKTCKERADIIMKIKELDPDSLNLLFETSETIGAKLQKKFGNDEGLVFLLSRKVPGEINVVTYKDGKVKIKVSDISEVLDKYGNFFSVPEKKSIYLEPGEFTKRAIAAKPLSSPPARRKLKPEDIHMTFEELNKSQASPRRPPPPPPPRTIARLPSEPIFVSFKDIHEMMKK